MSESPLQPGGFDETLRQMADGFVRKEGLPGALLDSARISLMAAWCMLPPEPLIVAPSDVESEEPTLREAIEQAMHWLNLARALELEESKLDPTSLHVVGLGGIPP